MTETPEHRRQFILSDHPLDYPNFSSIEFDGKYLSYHFELEVFRHQESILLGLAFQTASNKKDPREQLIELSDGEDILEMTSSWSGRWILINKDTIYADATGNLQCFYTVGERFVSSSLALLAYAAKCSDEYQYSPISHRLGMDWYPGPLTKFKNVMRLLGNQMLRIAGPYEAVPFDQVTSVPISLTEEEKIDEICSRMSNFIASVERTYDGEIFVPLTSGYDSRTLFAACVNANIKFSTFTLEHDKISEADRWIPRKLASAYKIKYQYVDRKSTFDSDRRDRFDSHCDCQCVDEDRNFHAFGQFDKVTSSRPRKLLFRGGVWACGKETYRDKKKKKNIQVTTDSNLSEKMENLFNAFENLATSELHSLSIKSWIENCEKIRNECLSFRSRFYLEQRMGGWLSALEQALDITDFDRVHPANCRDVISLLNSFSVETKVKKSHLIAISVNLAPRLAKIPYGDAFRPSPLNRLKMRMGNITPAKVISKLSRLPGVLK